MPAAKNPHALAHRFPSRWGIALFILTVAIYIPSIAFNGFIWDDPQYVVNNPALKSVEGLWQIWTDPTATPQYYPMVHTTFWIEAHLWGADHPRGFHVDNALLHALAVVLLLRLLVLLEIRAAVFAAAIFAVHPVMVESVTWITERKNVLSIVFYLLAFLAYLHRGLLLDRQALAGEAASPAQRRGWYVAALVFFLLALLSKTVTCSLPAAILLVIWWKRGSLNWRDVKPLLPMLIAGLVLSSVTSHLEHTQVGARGPDFAWSPMDRILIAGHAICFYALKLCWPHPLMFMYPKWDLHSDRALQFIDSIAVLMIVGSLWLSRKRIGRGPLVGVLFFIGTLVPALGFVNVYPMRYSFVADHFQYLASIGLITLVASLLYRISRWSVVVLLPLAWLTWQQQAIYRDAQTLWENTIAQNPTCWMAHTNLAGVLRAGDKPDQAMRQSKIALDLAPNEADTRYDYGLALAKHSMWESAIAQYELALQCDPQCAPALSDLSQLLWDHRSTPQDQAQALTDAQRAIAIQPNLGSAHYVLARVAELRGDLPTAIAEYGKALAINAQDYQSHFNLGNCLLQTGRAGEAAGEYLKVIDHDPKNAMALTNMGYACLAAGKAGDAAAWFQKALAIKPDLQRARDGLQQTRSP